MNVIKNLYLNDKHSLSQISQLTGMGRETIRQHLLQEKVRLRPQGGNNRRRTLDVFVTQGIDVHDIIINSKNQDEAAVTLGVSRTCLKRWLRKERDE